MLTLFVELETGSDALNSRRAESLAIKVIPLPGTSLEFAYAA
jgi:hypothetical protein